MALTSRTRLEAMAPDPAHAWLIWSSVLRVPWALVDARAPRRGIDFEPRIFCRAIGGLGVYRVGIDEGLARHHGRGFA